MTENPHPNILLLSQVARRLGPLLPEVVFVGGATVSLYLTRQDLPPVRNTRDVDVIVEVASRVSYYAFAEKLRQQGFKEDVESDILCRWCVEDIIVDVMPLEASILGFTNRWYGETFATAEERTITSGISLRLATPPCFVATKCEAFAGRGRGDFLLSLDIEDIVTLVLGRTELQEEIAASSPAMRIYLATQFRDYLANPDFLDALPGHVLPDAISQSRLPLVLQRMKALAALI